MKVLRFVDIVGIVVCIALGVFVLGGCSLFNKPYKPSKAFPTAIPENSMYSITYNAKGSFFITDHNGEALPAELIPLSVLLKASNTTRDDWLTVLGSFRLYQVKDDRSVWLCNEAYQCYRGALQDDLNKAVLSLNFDGKRLFISDADGRPVTPKDLSSFASMVEETDIDTRYGIKELSAFTIFKIIGSHIMSDCLLGKCLCTCLHEDGTKTKCENGGCP